jgi:hypothetical protein
MVGCDFRFRNQTIIIQKANNRRDLRFYHGRHEQTYEVCLFHTLL